MPRPPVKSVMVRFRAFPKELAAWKKLSRADAKTLSNWIRDRLNVVGPADRPGQSGPDDRNAP